MVTRESTHMATGCFDLPFLPEVQWWHSSTTRSATSSILRSPLLSTRRTSSGVDTSTRCSERKSFQASSDQRSAFFPSTDLTRRGNGTERCCFQGPAVRVDVINKG